VARQAGRTAAGVETEQAKMAEAVSGIMFSCFWKERTNICSLQGDVLLHQSVRLQYVLKIV
jgi:hypothetical protein